MKAIYLSLFCHSRSTAFFFLILIENYNILWNLYLSKFYWQVDKIPTLLTEE